MHGLRRVALDESNVVVLIDNYKGRHFPVQNEACLLLEFLAGWRAQNMPRVATYLSSETMWPQIDVLRFLSRTVLFVNDLGGLEKAAARECLHKPKYLDITVPGEDKFLAVLDFLAEREEVYRVLTIGFATGRFDFEGRSGSDEGYWWSGEYERRAEAEREAAVLYGKKLQLYLAFLEQRNLLEAWPQPTRDLLNRSIPRMSGGIFLKSSAADGSALAGMLAESFRAGASVGCLQDLCPKGFKKKKGSLKMEDENGRTVLGPRDFSCAARGRGKGQDRLEVLMQKRVLDVGGARFSLASGQLEEMGLQDLRSGEYLSITGDKDILQRRGSLKINAVKNGGYRVAIPKEALEADGARVLFESSTGKSALVEVYFR